MAQTWESKAPADVVVRRWAVPFGDDDDEISSVSAVGTGVTVDSSDYSSDTALITLSGGSAGTTGSVAVTVVTEEGETLTETFLIAIAANAQQLAYTVRDVVYFALRKVTGNGNDPDATEADDALERLNDMVALWRIDGLDVGIPGALALGDTLTIPDEFVSALKFNLRISCHDHYDVGISAFDAENAASGKALVRNKLFSLDDLAMPATLANALASVDPDDLN